MSAFWPQLEAMKMHPGFVDCCRDDCIACKPYREAEAYRHRQEQEWWAKHWEEHGAD